MKILKKIYSKLNNEILLASNCLGNEKGENILIIGVFHGDEPQGKYIIEKYLEKTLKAKNNLFFIPCLNPDGMAKKTRQNSNFVDINRNFSTDNWELTEKNEFWGGALPSSEIETTFLETVIQELNPNIILTLHAPYKVVNFDGPAEKIAKGISKIMNYPVKQDIGYPTPGSFGTYAGIERQIPTITLELDEDVPIESLYEPVFKVFDYLGTFVY